MSETPVKPISPDEAPGFKKTTFPGFVIDAWNMVIAKHYLNERACFKQDEIIAAISKAGDVSRQRIFDEKWLDVEDIYRSTGWIVEYDKPGYNEDYDANFTFRKKV